MKRMTEEQEIEYEKEYRRIRRVIIVTVIYLIICGLLYASTTLSELDSFVAVTHLPDPADAVPESEKININTASLEELKTLSGIGDVTAAKIIEYREEYGCFLNIDELTEINGIGDIKFDKLRPYVRI